MAIQDTPLRYASRLCAPATYYDLIEPVGGTDRPPLVLIHGGAHTGACYLGTPDGRPGWAQVLAQHGYRVIVPDWPGTGRSGYVDHNLLDNNRVCDDLGRLIASLGRKAIVLTHSISGGFGWQILEQHGAHIEKLVAVAPGEPGNIQPVAQILARDGDIVTVRRRTGSSEFTVNLREPMAPSRELVEHKLIGTGTRFPRAFAAQYGASLVAIPPRMIYQRLNVEGSQHKVADFTNFRGKRVMVLVGTHDLDHPVDVDRPIAEWLNSVGARADFVYLGDRGIHGNGHMMMLESNSDELAGLIADWNEAD